MAKSQHLQIRVTPEQKAALRRSAKQAGQGMSEYVLSRVLPPARLRFRELVRAAADRPNRSYALAELNDLLSKLTAPELSNAVAEGPPEGVSPYVANYVAAMVEQAANRKGAHPPGWVKEVEPLTRPRFIEPGRGLRPYLLASSPVPFRRRNIFIDSTVGDRV